MKASPIVEEPSCQVNNIKNHKRKVMLGVAQFHLGSGGNIIESMFSPHYMVTPTDQTSVLVQSSNDRDVSWTTKWEAPNGFSQETKVAKKEPI